MLASRNWNELALLFNILSNEDIIIFREKKTRNAKLKQLQGNVTFEFKGEKYEDLHF